MHEEQVLGKAYDARLMRRLLLQVLPYRGSVAAALGLIVLVSALSLAPPYLIKIGIDSYIRNHDVAGLGEIALVYILVLVGVFGLTYGHTWLMNTTGQRIMYDMRMRIFRHLQKMDVAFFNSNPVGRLMTRVTTDVDALNELFTSGVISVIGDIFTLVGIVCALFWINYKLALTIFSVVPILFILTFVFKVRVRESFRRVRTAIAKINGFLQENISGVAVVKLFNQESKQYEKFTSINREHMDANLQSIFYYAIFYPLIELVGAAAVALIVWYGGFQVIEGAMSIGALVAFVQYSERFFRPISDLSEKYTIMQQAMASSERIFTLLDITPSITSQQVSRLREPANGKVQFLDVSFSYADDTKVLSHISFSVHPGETLALVGQTGAGKSTIASLLNRFYDVDEGRILIDGIDIQEFELKTLRRSVGIVQQDVFLFSGTIMENIRLGRQDINEHQVQAAAQAVHANGFIERLPDGYSTRIGERGFSLSTGQKQLLAFARVLVFSPKILILDEATSSIDTDTEILIRQALERILDGRTSIIIAHRLSTIQKADRILVLHHGQVREVGTHHDLLDLKGIYWRLYQLQYDSASIRAEPQDGSSDSLPGSLPQQDDGKGLR